MDNREAREPRARGRARGRSRGVPPDGDGARPPARPTMQQGPPQQYPPQQRPPQQHPPQQHHQPGPSGDIPVPSRGVQRGPQVASGLSREMGSLQLQSVLLGSRKAFDPSLFDPRTRPSHIQDKKGFSGQPIPLIANFFPLACARDWVLNQYRIDFNPEVDHKGARRGMLRDHKELLGNFMFDGTMLFTTKRLPDKTTEVFSTRRTDGEKIRITIQHTNELPANSPISLQVYNLVFRRALEMLEMKQVGRNYYNPKLATVVDCQRVKFELWPGFLTSILQYEQRVMLCAEISHKLMRKESVLDVIKDMSQQRGGSFREKVSKFLIGQIVLTRYNNNTYRIDGIEWDINVSMTFERRGQPISYVDYYKEQYNVTITDPRQPLLLSRPKKKDIRRGGIEIIHLIPELCSVTGLTDELRSDYHVMKRLGEHTKQGPQQRAQSLTNFVKKMMMKPEISNEFEKWGLSMEPKLLSLKGGRVLPPEKIAFGGGKEVYGGPKASWDHELRNIRMSRNIDLESWIFIHTKRDNEIANNFVKMLIQAARGLGFNIRNPFRCPLDADHASQYQGAIKSSLQSQRGMQMVTCMLPSNRKDRYDAIKKLCCVDMPVPSQVVLAKTLAKGGGRAMSVCTKVAIQMNCKLGGEAWRVDIPLKRCMVIGVDTYHDSSQKGRSVAGFVASVSGNFARWYSNVTFQEPGQELSDGLVVCMRGALMRYKQFNQELPTRIIVFRDGVGDGQLDHLLGHEVPQYQKCFATVNENYKPNLTFVVVKKRINARFFHPPGNGPLGNPPPGTVIDDEVTRPDWYDFFIVSQSVREGTVSPTHYNVIFDSSGLKPDHIQRLSYKLCHLYYNWAGTIRVPAPCLYAHKLAFLVGQSVHTQVAPILSDRLYFL